MNAPNCGESSKRTSPLTESNTTNKVTIVSPKLLIDQVEQLAKFHKNFLYNPQIIDSSLLTWRSNGDFKELCKKGDTIFFVFVRIINDKLSKGSMGMENQIPLIQLIKTACDRVNFSKGGQDCIGTKVQGQSFWQVANKIDQPTITGLIQTCLRQNQLDIVPSTHSTRQGNQHRVSITPLPSSPRGPSYPQSSVGLQGTQGMRTRALTLPVSAQQMHDYFQQKINDDLFSKLFTDELMDNDCIRMRVFSTLGLDCANGIHLEDGDTMFHLLLKMDNNKKMTLKKFALMSILFKLKSNCLAAPLLNLTGLDIGDYTKRNNPANRKDLQDFIKSIESKKDDLTPVRLANNELLDLVLYSKNEYVSQNLIISLLNWRSDVGHPILRIIASQLSEENNSLKQLILYGKILLFIKWAHKYITGAGGELLQTLCSDKSIFLDFFEDEDKQLLDSWFRQMLGRTQAQVVNHTSQKDSEIKKEPVGKSTETGPVIRRGRKRKRKPSKDMPRLEG